MWKQIQQNRGLIIIAAIALIAGGGLGVLVGLAMRAPDPEAAQTGHVGVASVLPDTRLERQTAFTNCNHIKTDALPTASFIGYTQEELAAFYQDCEILEFSGERIVLAQTIDACCPEHVQLRMENDGALCVYQTDAALYVEHLIRVLAIEMRADFSAEEAARLKEGLIFDSLSEIDAYLEGLES